MEKYFLYVDEVTLALKYSSRDSCLTIGGYTRFRRTLTLICEEYFGLNISVDVASFSLTQRNKCRYIFEMDYKTFIDGLKKIEEHGFVLQKANNLERIMR